MEQTDFPTRLRIARGRRGWTIEGLASRAGLSPTAISNLENGDVKRPRVQTVIKLADALGIEPEELLEPNEVAS